MGCAAALEEEMRAALNGAKQRILRQFAFSHKFGLDTIHISKFNSSPTGRAPLNNRGGAVASQVASWRSFKPIPPGGKPYG
jgi:hypothetical protein